MDKVLQSHRQAGHSLRRRRLAIAVEDLIEGWCRYWMWSRLALQDIKMRYRGSVLGPFWVTISTIVLIVALAFVYPRILNIPASDYVPYLTIGLVCWSFISSVINEGCQTFVSASHILQQVRLPLSLYVYHSVCRNVMTSAHSFVLLPIVVWLFDVPIGWSVVLAVPAILVLVLNAFWVTLLLGMVSARFRDIPPIVGNFVTIAFFMTPVFWRAQVLSPSEQWLVKFNPFFCALDVIRAPLLGEEPLSSSWPLLLAATVLGVTLTLLFFARWRSRIVYWA